MFTEALYLVTKELKTTAMPIKTEHYIQIKVEEVKL